MKYFWLAVMWGVIGGANFAAGVVSATDGHAWVAGLNFLAVCLAVHWIRYNANQLPLVVR